MGTWRGLIIWNLKSTFCTETMLGCHGLSAASLSSFKSREIWGLEHLSFLRTFFNKNRTTKITFHVLASSPGKSKLEHVLDLDLGHLQQASTQGSYLQCWQASGDSILLHDFAQTEHLFCTFRVKLPCAYPAFAANCLSQSPLVKWYLHLEVILHIWSENHHY